MNLYVKIINNLAAQLELVAAQNFQPLVLCSAPIRSQFRKLVERFIPNIIVLSYDEILNTQRITLKQPLFRVTLQPPLCSCI